VRVCGNRHLSARKSVSPAPTAVKDKTFGSLRDP